MEMIYTIYRKRLDKLTPIHYNDYTKKGVWYVGS